MKYMTEIVDEILENKLKSLLDNNKDLNTYDLTKKIIELFNNRCPGCKMVIDRDENGKSKTECYCYGY